MKIIKSLLLLLIVSLSFSTASLTLASETTDGLDAAAKQIPAYSSQTGATNPRDVVLEKVGGLVGLALSFVGIIFLLLIIYAGLQWMTAQGNAGQVDKAKDLMINAVIGLVIVTAAYSLTIFFGTQFTQTP